jgi:glycosyltransferase involved in cell wall biosynthesis
MINKADYGKVSIVIPIYNVEKYITHCLDTVIHQTYSNLEIILVNDGSSDKSAELCQNYVDNDSRIKLINKVNGGLSDARNVGMDYATGIYITFIDSDDEVKHDYIEYLLELLVNNNADASVCQKQFISESGEEIPLNDNKIKNITFETTQDCLKDFLVNKNIETTAWGKLYFLSKISDIKFPVGKFHEDIFTTYKFLMRCNIVAVGSEAKYLYRKRENSITSTMFSERHLDSIYGCIERAEVISSAYPELGVFARGRVIISANSCLVKMCDSGSKEYIGFLKAIYKKYWIDFKKAKITASLKTKTMAFLGRYNIYLLYCLIKLLY